MTRSRWRKWAWPSELRQRGILGMNGRNASYILPCNPRRHYRRLDDKLITKRICEGRGIAVPETYVVIERQGDVCRVLELVADHRQFVVKPTRGSEGRGIMVIAERNGDELITVAEEKVAVTDLHYHLSAILAGLYSLSGQPDRVIIEQRIVLHPVFEEIAVGGTPDIRVILFRGIPVMAMVRLPTWASGGRANLHQGALGVGVHLLSGETFGGVCESRAVTVHPDTGEPIAGLKIPRWKDLLREAMSLADSLEMGYIGVDFVLDTGRGPVVLEANARPGLSIQIANRAGLLRRLEQVDSLSPAMLSPHRRMEVVARLAEV